MFDVEIMSTVGTSTEISINRYMTQRSHEQVGSFRKFLHWITLSFTASHFFKFRTLREDARLGNFHIVFKFKFINDTSVSMPTYAICSINASFERLDL